MILFTIGFTKKSAEEFFTRLQKAGVRRLLDIRLNNTSQLAGFAKREDLQYFLKTICDIDYLQLPDLAPTQAILDDYKKRNGDWTTYAVAYLTLLHQRKVEEFQSRDLFDQGCLLCSEKTPEHCHRRLAAEYLKDQWGNVEIIHL